MIYSGKREPLLSRRESKEGKKGTAEKEAAWRNKTRAIMISSSDVFVSYNLE
jgi:hypothetical protein